MNRIEDMSEQWITVLGSTGSIGCSTLDVVARHPGRFRVFALTAHRQVDVLFAQCAAHQPRFAVMVEESAAQALRMRLEAEGLPTTVLTGAKALEVVAQHEEVDAVMAAIVGSAGLPATLAAAQAGKRVLLANKESLVLAGALFMETVDKHGAVLLPIDSEHNAIFQCLPAHYARHPEQAGVRRLLLTASGGPFRSTPLADFAGLTPAQACAHPKWQMGQKISVDSASMMNKGLEVIEAHWLFGVSDEAIQVVVHPQSVIHSMVEYADGSVLAQLGNPDMRTPIANALAYPGRIESGAAFLDLFQIAKLEFEAPDFKRFPCLRLAFEALKAGGSAPGALNAANEEAVAAFLVGHIRFIDIANVVQAVLERMAPQSVATLEAVLAVDQLARQIAQQAIASCGSK